MMMKKAEQNIVNPLYQNKIRLILSLALTPVVIFGITSIDLYIKNRQELENQVLVLLPFVILIITSIILGLILYKLAERNNHAKILLMAYYALTPLFIAYKFSEGLELSLEAKILLFLLLPFGIVIYMYRKVALNSMVSFFSLLTIAIVLAQIPITFNSLKRSTQVTDSVLGNDSISQNYPTETISQRDEKLPNIYHLILDEYQTDMFELTLNDHVKNKLGGFIYYPNNRVVYGKTGMSLASIFNGVSYDFSSSRSGYEKEAFTGDGSLLYWLKNAGYRTEGIVHRTYKHGLALFDNMITHDQNSPLERKTGSDMNLFFSLWAYSILPETVSKQLIGSEEFDQFKSQNVLPDNLPAMSYESYKKVIGDDRLLTQENTYTLLHLIIPHSPYVLKGDCTYESGLKSTPLEQSQCATKIAVEFLDRLKELSMFEDSLIIIQADHGARFEVVDGNLVQIPFHEDGEKDEHWAWARARGLLLLKPPDRKSSDPLFVSKSNTSILDVAPTIVELTGIEAKMRFEGFSLSNSLTMPILREEFNYYYPEKMKGASTTGYFRYIYKEGSSVPEFDRLIQLKNR